MRSFRLLATLVALSGLSASLTRAAILSVHPTAGHGTHTSLQSAIDDAADGDVIHVAGAITNYGDITVSKKLTIYGPGYFLDENLSLSGDTLPATIGSLTVSGTAAADTLISGLTIGEYAYLAADRVILRRCHIQRTVYLGADSTGQAVSTTGLTLLGCYLAGDVDSEWNKNENTPSTGILISGCYIQDPNVDLASRYASGTLRNCVIADQYPSTTHFRNWNLYNNIFRGYTGTLYDGVAHHNIILGGAPEEFSLPGTNNVFLSGDTGVFVGTGSTDARWQLAPGSPAIGAGTGASDCGMFANGYYVLSGIPSLPIIKSLDLPAEISNRADLRLSVEVRVQP